MRELRLTLFAWIVLTAVWFLPKDAYKTAEWLQDIPFED